MLAQALSSRRLFASKELIINAVGTDRLGIVSDMTKHVTGVGGNVGESQASKLGNYFSLMMLVNVPEGQVVALVDQLEELEDITASVHMVKDDAKTQPVSTAAIGCKNLYTINFEFVRFVSQLRIIFENFPDRYWEIYSGRRGQPWNSSQGCLGSGKEWTEHR